MSRRVETLRSAWEAMIRANQEREVPTSSPPYVYASRFHVCDRAMALDLIHPEDRGAWSVESMERFDRGLEIERMMVARLMRAGAVGGFAVEAGQKRYEILGRDLRYDDGRLVPVIVGKIDGMIRFNDQPGSPIPFDVKSGAAIQHVDSIDRLLDGRWTRHMLYQILAYCYGEGADVGLLVLDRTAGPLFLEVRLEDYLEEMEEFIAAAEIAVHCRSDEEAELPVYHEDASECYKCDHFRKSCSPDLAFGPGLTLITDEAIHELAAKVVELRELGLQYNRADRAIKEKLRGIELASIGGDFDVVGRWNKSTRTVYPDSCPNCDCPIEPAKVSDPKGRFILSIERAAPTDDAGGGDSDDG